MATTHGKVTYHNIDISFDPNDDGANFEAGDAETSSRRKATVDLVWRNLSFTVPKKQSKEEKEEQKRQASGHAQDDQVATDEKGNPIEQKEHLPDIDFTGSPSNARAGKNKKVILHGVSGYVRPGTMVSSFLPHTHWNSLHFKDCFSIIH